MPVLKGAMLWYLLSFKKLNLFFKSIEFQKNGPVLLFKTIFSHWNCFLLSVATDRKDGRGLKLEEVGPTFSSLTVKLTKPWTPKILIECYCVVRKQPIRHEKTKPQTTTVISLRFWGLLPCPEHYCDWSPHNEHSWNVSCVHGFSEFHSNCVPAKITSKIILVSAPRWNFSDIFFTNLQQHFVSG